MKQGWHLYVNLWQSLQATSSTLEKKALVAAYFAQAPAADKTWALALFCGRKPKKMCNSKELLQWCGDYTGLPEWLLQESYQFTGDLAETIALLIPRKDERGENPTTGATEASATNAANSTSEPVATAATIRSAADWDLVDFLDILLSLSTASPEAKKAFLFSFWDNSSPTEAWVGHKIITGGFRIGVAQTLVEQALSQLLQVSPADMALRLSGNWTALTHSFDDLLSGAAGAGDHSKPYPFYLCHALDTPLENLGPAQQWQAEWKWDGMRGQLVQRNQSLHLWSRGEELVTEHFPELAALASHLPDGLVLDGEIICYQNNQPLPFAHLQKRMGKKKPGKKLLQDYPVVFLAYDLLEWQGQDLRTAPLAQRRQKLATLLTEQPHPLLVLSPALDFAQWTDLEALHRQAREAQAEGLVLKHLDSAYGTGRKKGEWWKWKTAPLHIDAVLLYAQKGHGRRSNWYTDYTFAVWEGERLVTFAKAYSGLTDAEIKEVDAFVKTHGKEKFGPVRTVDPQLVFEIGFEGIAASNRHKSGVALRFPRILRWRKDKPVSEANSLQDLHQLLKQYGA